MAAHDFLTGPTYDVNAHIARMRAAWERYPLKERKAQHAHTLGIMKRVVDKLPKPPANYALEIAYGTIVLLFEAEGIYNSLFLFEENAGSPPTFYKQPLLDLERTMSPAYRERAESAVVSLLTDYFTKGPDGLYVEEADAGTTVPFPELVDTWWWTSRIIQSLTLMDGDKPLFPKSCAQIMQNLYAASGKEQGDDAKKLTYPKDSKLDGGALAHAYLHDTPFHALLAACVPFSIPQPTRFSGQWVIAPPNRGKTNMLLHQVMEDVNRPGTIILMDSKGDLIDAVRDLKLPKETVIIDPQPNLALNPLDIGGHAVDILEYLLSVVLEAKLTALQSTLFRYVIMACVRLPQPSLLTFRDIVQNGLKNHDPSKLSPDVRDFFAEEFSTQTYRETRQQIQWRIRLLLSNEVIRSMLSSPVTKIRIGELMDGNKLVIINNSKAMLGDFGSEFFGRFFISLVLSAAQQRAGRRPEDKPPVYFYIDECHTVIARDDKIATILDECRSQKIALILAHQRMAQIVSPNVLDALANCAIRYANSDDDASHLAPRLRTTPEALRSLPIGSFATFVRDTTKQAVTLKIPLMVLSKVPRMDAEERAALRARMRELYCYIPEPSKAPEPAAEIIAPPEPEMPKPAAQSTAETAPSGKWPME